MSATATPQVICFDLGRVLVRLVDGWNHACRLAGLPGDSEQWPAENRRRISALNEQFEVGRLSAEEFYRRAAAILQCGDAHIRAIYDQWLRGLFEGVDQLITDLHDRGLVTGCLSNTNARHWDIMMERPAYGPLRRLHHRHASHLLGVAKPDPSIYRRFERAVGAAGPRIIYFDDLSENISAAADRNWRAHRIDPDADPLPQIRSALQIAGVFPG